MPRKISINSKSTGKFEKRMINNREHIVTSMVSIVGDSVMNRLAYPFSQIVNSFQQLNNLHAPASHPKVDGENISAFHPLAINANHVGGIVLSPKMEGRKVINELAFDIEIANRDDRGKEIIRRIEDGEEIPVSTGLNADIDKQSGIMGNEEFDGIVTNIKFDHVAILLDTAPAGSETFTINSEDVMICNLAESVDELEEKVHQAVHARFGDGSWPAAILFNPERVIVRKGETLISIAFGYNDAGDVVFTGDEIPVERKVSFEPLTNVGTLNQGVNDMDHEKFVLALIANSANSYTNADKDKLMGMSETGLAAILSNAEEVTVEQATAVIDKAGLHVNNITAEDHAEYVAAKPALDELKASQATARKEMTEKVIANSKMTQEQLDPMDMSALENLANSIVSTADYGMRGAITTNASQGSDIQLHKGA